MPLPHPCPFCAEPIREEAFRCAHCHAWLVPWTFRHKEVPGLLGLGAAFFLFYDYARDSAITSFAGWFLIAMGTICSLYGLYHLLRSSRSAFEEGRKELLERYRKKMEEREED